jgi:hypothetical protein
MTHWVRDVLEAASIIVLGLPLLGVVQFLLKGLLVPVNSHASPVGNSLLCHRFALRMVSQEVLFSLIQPVIEGELIQERPMVGVNFLFVFHSSSRHLDLPHLLVSHFGRLHSASVNCSFHDSKRLF